VSTQTEIKKLMRSVLEVTRNEDDGPLPKTNDAHDTVTISVVSARGMRVTYEGVFLTKDSSQSLSFRANSESITRGILGVRQPFPGQPDRFGVLPGWNPETQPRTPIPMGGQNVVPTLMGDASVRKAIVDTFTNMDSIYDHVLVQAIITVLDSQPYRGLALPERAIYRFLYLLTQEPYRYLTTVPYGEVYAVGVPVMYSQGPNWDILCRSIAPNFPADPKMRQSAETKMSGASSVTCGTAATTAAAIYAPLNQPVCVGNLTATQQPTASPTRDAVGMLFQDYNIRSIIGMVLGEREIPTVTEDELVSTISDYLLIESGSNGGDLIQLDAIRTFLDRLASADIQILYAVMRPSGDTIVKQYYRGAWWNQLFTIIKTI
jgi:hypothetical protein